MPGEQRCGADGLSAQRSMPARSPTRLIWLATKSICGPGASALLPIASCIAAGAISLIHGIVSICDLSRNVTEKMTRIPASA